MPKTSTSELQELTTNAIRVIKSDLLPKADDYFGSPETTALFDERLAALNDLQEELKREPRFTIHLLGSAQNGKSTLINVLLGKKILTEGHVGACSAAVVRCCYEDIDDHQMTVRYVSRPDFLAMLQRSLSEAETALAGEEPSERAGEVARRALARFSGFFGIGDHTPQQIVTTCKTFLANPDTIEFSDFGVTREISVNDEQLVRDHLAAQGRNAFVVEECVLKGRFPNWPPQMELVDMPGTNDFDPFRTSSLTMLKSELLDANAKTAALAQYDSARQAWSELAAVATPIYKSDLTYGRGARLRGHWNDRLKGIDNDIAAMNKGGVIGTPPHPGSTSDAIATVQKRLTRPAANCHHTAPGTFAAGESLTLVLQTAGADTRSVNLYYRRVNQADAWQVAPMQAMNGHFEGTIPGAYTQTDYPLQYYFGLAKGKPGSVLFPGFDANLANQPYFVVRLKT